jgi:hypothetical protein
MREQRFAYTHKTSHSSQIHLDILNPDTLPREIDNHIGRQERRLIQISKLQYLMSQLANQFRRSLVTAPRNTRG